MENLQSSGRLQRLISQIKALPLPKTEESILLRVLVQAMVIVGIIATDVASQSPFPMSFWAVPLSIVGAIVSWRRRKQKNIALKFTLAIGMLVALVFFLGNLVGSINDARLILAELLVQLQVLHSFDLPRRKDLGYSMVIGLILIGVSATVSQTLAFAPWLLLLLILGIPTLILDYRSRMGLQTWEQQWQTYRQRQKYQQNSFKWQNSSLSPRKIFSSFFIILCLGLIIFAVMPRSPGYQIQSFPVSAPEEYRNRDFVQGDRSIVNPGYNLDGTIRQRGDGSGEEDGESSDYYGFNTQINQNFSNVISQKELLLRIRSQYPGFWRVLAFDEYTGQGWKIAREEQTSEIRRSPWSFRFNLSLPAFQGETKKVIQTYTAVKNLPNIIPNLRYPSSIYFPTPEIALDTEGSLRSPAGLIEGFTYTVISEVPYRRQSELQATGNKYPELISKYYLDVPSEIKDKIKVKAQELLAKADRPLESNYDQALYLAQALKQNYRRQTEIPPLAEGEDLAETFLYQNQGGYPDHFATVYTLMLRSLGIPARLAVGFASGDFNPFTGYYLVHNTDAHAMTEVYFPDYGWFDFDPLPGHEIIPLSFQEDNPFGVLGLLWKWVASWLPSPITAFVATLFSKIVDGFLAIFQSGWLSKLWQFVTGSLIGVLVGVVGILILAFLSWLAFNYLQKWLYTLRLNKLPPMAKLYQEMLDFLQSKGYPKSKIQTPYEYSQSLDNSLLAEQLNIINLITNSYTQWRYGQVEQNLAYLRSQFQLLRKSMKK